MKARAAYRLIVRRGGVLPALLAPESRVDHVEVVDLASGEVELFWDCPPARAKQLARALREELSKLEAEEFLARWRAVR